MRTNKYVKQGISDGRRKKFNPPSKGTSKTRATIIGGVLGLGVGGPGGLVLGSLIGNLVGDSKEELRQKKKKNGSYRHGNKIGRMFR